MKKRIAIIRALLSLLPLGQPLVVGTVTVLTSAAVILLTPEKSLANPNTYLLDFNNALQTHEKGDFTLAISQWQKILKDNPNLSKQQTALIYVNTSLSYSELQKNYAALQYINMAIDIDPHVISQGRMFALRGMYSNKNKDRQAACLDWNIANELGNKHAELLLKKFECN
tara:strand:- start:445 stop:954 length:510 start_codon:yes stop_codon:yes gene_type:complete